MPPPSAITPAEHPAVGRVGVPASAGLFTAPAEPTRGGASRQRREEPHAELPEVGDIDVAIAVNVAHRFRRGCKEMRAIRKMRRFRRRRARRQAQMRRITSMELET